MMDNGSVLCDIIDRNRGREKWSVPLMTRCDMC